MPIYEYRCENEHRFEAFQPMADDALDTCEVCGAPAQRVLSAPALHFKGSGFYTTDYARKGKPSGAEDGGDSKGGGDSKDGGDSKGEKKSGEKKGESSSGSNGVGSKSDKKAGSASTD